MNNSKYYPLVSVIVPVYNVAPYLERCVNSIEEQSYDHLEIILIDDGSTDLSGELCDTLASKDERISVFHSDNHGLSAARNLGLKHAHGDWIIYVDPDDSIGPNHVFNLLATALGAGTKIAVTDYTLVPNTTKKFNYIRKIPNLYAVFDAQEAICLAATKSLFTGSACCRICSISLAPLLIFPEGKCYEDQFVAYPVFLAAGKVAYENANDYYYTRFRPTSITGKKGSNQLDLLEADKELIRFAKENNLEDAVRVFTGRYYAHLVGNFANFSLNGQPKLAEETYQEIISQRREALRSSATATTTKIAMLLSFFPRKVFSKILRATESYYGKAMKKLTEENAEYKVESDIT